MNAKTRLGRPPNRREEIFTTLLQRIVRGEILPGERMPTHRHICREFDASPSTVQDVLRDLAKAGFTQAHSTRGTFVHQKPPHLHHYAVVCFQQNPLATRVFAIHRQEALRMKEEGWHLEIVDLPREPLRNQAVWDLAQRVRSHLYAGLIFTSSPDHLMETPIMDTPDMPRVILYADLTTRKDDYGVTTQGIPFFFERAIAKIKELKGQRVGVIMHSTNPADRTMIHDLFHASGIETRRAWIHAIHYHSRDEAYPLLELLLSLPPDQRPDTLIIADDNLTEAVTLGVRDFCPAGQPIQIISHCNYPWLPTAHVPVHWLGYDSRDILLRAIGLIEDVRKNLEIPDRFVQTPLKFENDLE